MAYISSVYKEFGLDAKARPAKKKDFKYKLPARKEVQGKQPTGCKKLKYDPWKK